MNDLRYRRSILVDNIALAGAAVVYRSKTQTQTALSSTEAEFYAAVSAAKIVRYLRFILSDLGFPQKEPTIIYEDNESAKKIIDAVTPTERSRHIAITYFAIQDWKKDDSIQMKYIPGKINHIADALSHSQVSLARQWDPNLDLLPEIVPEEWALDKLLRD